MTAEHASTSGWTLSGRHIVTVADRDNISALGNEVYDNTGEDVAPPPSANRDKTRGMAAGCNFE